MKLNNAISSHAGEIFEVEGALEMQQATLIGDASLFNILSRMYSRPIEAVVRETACNARDAHVDAGTEDRPFDVYLPTKLKPEFIIRDYGTGLSKEQTLNLFTVYGFSTKKNSERTIGHFGLGSKAFFAVTDQATITSWHGGKRMMFSFSKDAEDKPVMILVEEVDSVEPSGLRIAYAVPEARFGEYEQAAESVFARWTDPQPNIYGDRTTFNKVKYSLFESGLYGVRDHRSGGTFRPNGIYAIMGGVAYLVDTDQVDAADGLSYAHIDLFFGLGELKPSPSRESLEYTPAVIAAIEARLVQIKDLIKARVEAQWAGVTSLFDAMDRRKQLDPLLNSLPGSLRNWALPNMTFKGIEIPYHKESACLSGFSSPLLAKNKSHIPDEPVARISQRVARSFGPRGNQYADLTRPVSIVLVPPTIRSQAIHNRLAKIREDLHEQALLIYADTLSDADRNALVVYGLTETPIHLGKVVEDKVKIESTKTQLKQWGGGEWKSVEVEFDAGGLFLLMEQGATLWKGSRRSLDDVRAVMNHIYGSKIIDQPIYGIPKTLKARTLKHAGWRPLEDVVEQEMMRRLPEAWDVERNFGSQLQITRWRNFPEAVINRLSANHPLRAALAEAKDVIERQRQVDALICLFDRLSIKRPESKPSPLLAKFEAFSKRHPLVRAALSSPHSLVEHNTPGVTDAIVAYLES